MVDDVISISTTERTLRTEELTAKSLDDLLMHCIDEALLDLVGVRSREAVYDYLERQHSLSRNEIPKHLNVFLSLLDDTFGKSGKIIGRAIMKRLYDKLEWKFESVPGFEFMDYMDALRARIARTLLEKARSSKP